MARKSVAAHTPTTGKKRYFRTAKRRLARGVTRFRAHTLAIFDPKVPRSVKKYRYTATLEGYREASEVLYRYTATQETRSNASGSAISVYRDARNTHRSVGEVLYWFTATPEIRSEAPNSTILVYRDTGNT